MKKTFSVIFLITFCIFFFSWLLVYKTNVNSLPVQSEDTVPAIFLPLSILNNHSLYLDQYYPMMLDRYPNPDDRSHALGMVPFYLRKVGEHYVSAFPIITPILALPFFYIGVALKLNFDWNTLYIFTHISSAFILALSSSLFYLLLAGALKIDRKKSLILTVVYSFCTINFAHISQGLWQHGTVQLFTIASLIFYLKFLEKQSYTYLFYFGLFSGISILSRPTAGLALVVLSVPLVFNKDFFKRSVAIGSGMLFPVAFFIWYNARYYVSIENQGYANQLLKNWLGDFPVSFFGVWLSPSKGILVYSPVLLFSIVGSFIAFKKNSIVNRNFYILSAIIVLLHTLIISFWKHWFGGWSFGYRMTSDVIPFLVLLIIPWIQSNKSRIAYKIFIVTLVFSLFVQLAGMVYFDGIWHAAYDRGFKDPRWLWSIKDSEFAFNLRRTAVKLGYLDRACPTCAK